MASFTCRTERLGRAGASRLRSLPRRVAPPKLDQAVLFRRTAERTLRWALAVVASLPAVGCGHTAPPPNVILISIDCLSQRQLKQSWDLQRAPILAGLAKDALVFRRAYAHAPWTTPSHMSMLTGLYPSQHGRDIPWGLMIRYNAGYDRVPLFRTLPERLRHVGYETVAFVGGGPMSAKYGLGRGFDTYHESGRNNAEQSDLPETLSGIEAWLGSRKPGPFFLFVHTYELHYPLAHSPFWRALDYLDGHLGKLLSLLRRRGLYDSSLLILTGDHGSRMIRNEDKCSLHGAGHYEENLRVPFILKLPGNHPTGPRGTTVRHVDILPTVLDVAGVPVQSYDGPGVSIVGHQARGVAAEHDFSFSEADGRCWWRRAVVGERYKYIYTPHNTWSRLLQQSPLFFDDLCRHHPACAQVPPEELYDLIADPFEETNLLESPLEPAAAAALEQLRAELLAHINQPPAYRRVLVTDSTAAEGIKGSTEEALRALGYLR